MASTPTVIISHHIVTTAGVHQTMHDHDDNNELVHANMSRHFAGDWGTLNDPHDSQANDEAVATKDQILSIYPLPEPRQVTTNHGPPEVTALWIISDPGWDTTTVLWPPEY